MATRERNREGDMEHLIPASAVSANGASKSSSPSDSPPPSVSRNSGREVSLSLSRIFSHPVLLISVFPGKKKSGRTVNRYRASILCQRNNVNFSLRILFWLISISDLCRKLAILISMTFLNSAVFMLRKMRTVRHNVYCRGRVLHEYNTWDFGLVFSQIYAEFVLFNLNLLLLECVNRNNTFGILWSAESFLGGLIKISILQSVELNFLRK